MVQVSCSSSSPEDSGAPTPRSGKINVYVVNYPLQYFAERIGGKHVEVVFPDPKDQDPAFVMPSTKTITAYQNAELILLNGAGYAKWVNKVSLPQSKLCDTSSSFANRYLEVKDAVSHQHGTGNKHSHAGPAFTTWLDPKLALLQTEAVRDRLIRLRPQHKETFEQNYHKLREDLEQLDDKIARIVAQSPKQPILFSHPVYQYFTRRYGLVAKSVHWEPDEMPKAKQWQELQGILKAHPAKFMLWESTPLPATVEKLKKQSIQSVVFDPCSTHPAEGDYLAVMNRNAENLVRVFSKD